jgi:hypothetical protein
MDMVHLRIRCEAKDFSREVIIGQFHGSNSNNDDDNNFQQRLSIRIR